MQPYTIYFNGDNKAIVFGDDEVDHFIEHIRSEGYYVLAVIPGICK